MINRDATLNDHNRIDDTHRRAIHAIAEDNSVENKLSDEKNRAEGAPGEIKICLGLQINSRLLLRSLPPNKYEVWDAQIVSVIKSRSVSGKE